ncbi:hypothetical protein Leryth_025831 [Lithospermum erythrorhizon]|nr:hypothetical protein Leryth_025831 [Lithospermum erythrorhizon]
MIDEKLLCMYEIFQKAVNHQEKNVSLFDIASGNVVLQLFQKNMTRATWPVVKFNGDESVGCRLATNEVQFYDPGDFSKGFVNRLRVQGVAAVSFKTIFQSYVAVFVPNLRLLWPSVLISVSGTIWKRSSLNHKGGMSVTSEWSPDVAYFMTAVARGYKLIMADWKPESPEMFVDIEVFVKSVDSLKIEEPKSQGSKLK